jgi:2'-5' RNA ligase
MARFVVVLPLVPLAAGDEFTVADWPLHVTLVEPFATELTAEAVAHVLGPVASGAHVVTAAAGDEAMFGRRRDVPVTLVRDHGELEALRMRALEAIRIAGVHIAVDPSRKEFRPHVTRKQHGRLRPGDRVVLDTLALIDMRPPEGSHHRRVMAAWRLGGASAQQAETGAKPPPP